MTVSYDFVQRTGSAQGNASLCLEDKFEVLKDIGDGSFGSVVLARVRSAGAHVARRGTLVAIKSMKKTFDSLAPCLELREVVFLRTLPIHPHLVPALDIFLDPFSKKLHICMEYMDGNLYQLMKARDHKCFDGSSVKSILFQILAGLEHIHAHSFFHRDIKPENILVSTSSPQGVGGTFRRYSSLVTPPSTPPVYTIKIADFGLARETHSKLPYTTYVSTRWYRAPEVLLRAGEYSAPVDIWALGAMAVEVATLKPLFPGGNEVDQVWRVCEIMGSPGNWYNKHGARVGGGDWKDGTKLAQKLGFSFPKMAPHSIDTILRPNQWPVSLSNFVTWCLMWDPKARPTSTQALNHEYFADAVDPLRPKSAASRKLGRKQSDIVSSRAETPDQPSLNSKPSWFRKSLIGRESAPAVPQVSTGGQSPSIGQSPTISTTSSPNIRPRAEKRATWTNGVSNNGAPMPILPSIRPISPFSDAVTAQAHDRIANATEDKRRSIMDDKTVKKIGRQLSVASHGNHYADLHRQEAERALNANSGLASPPGGQKESFFSHLRKRARRLSGRHQAPLSPSSDDIEANAGCGPWSSNRSSMAIDPVAANSGSNFAELDKTMMSIRSSVEGTTSTNAPYNGGMKQSLSMPGNGPLKRHHSFRQEQHARSVENLGAIDEHGGPISSRTRRAMKSTNYPANQYETPEEADELLDEVLEAAHKATKTFDQGNQARGVHRSTSLYDETNGRSPLRQSASNLGLQNPYPTPSPSAKRDGVTFGQEDLTSATKPLDIKKGRGKKDDVSEWPTPPYEESEWASAAAASIQAAGGLYR